MTDAVLTKSRYLAGLQCLRRVWLAVHRPELATPFDDATLQRMEDGILIGRAAHALHPSDRALLVDTPGRDFDAALQETRVLLEDDRLDVLFEAAFEHASVRIRVDVLQRDGRGGFALCEVKSSTSVKPEHVPDVAVQRWVLEGSGLPISRVELRHIDSSYVRGEDGIDWRGLFVDEELTNRPGLEAERVRTPEQVREMLDVLDAGAPPEVEPSSHCRKPHLCPFWAHCTAEKSRVWQIRQRRQSEATLARWEAATRSGESWISPRLGELLETIDPPVWYLDFEALNGALPLYPGTHPYEQIPFQWSLHRLERDGTLVHEEFLADGAADPRAAVAASMIDALAGDAAPIVVYSGYEHQRIGAMAVVLPDLAEGLHAVDERLVDLLQIVRSCIYHPEFLGSFSIKKVGPALAPQLTYGDLEGVADGTAAAAAFARIATGEVEGEAAGQLRRQLLAYCERDTLAMVEVHRALLALAG